MTETQTTFERLYLDHGPIVSGEILARIAGFSTLDALRMAYHRKSVGFPIFRIQGRRGFFAHTTDVAQWLNSLGRTDNLKEANMT